MLPVNYALIGVSILGTNFNFAELAKIIESI